MLLILALFMGISFTPTKLNQKFEIFFYYLILFFLGSVLMRSAGCIVNDIVDKDFDKKVERTKNRPIASDRISIKRSFLCNFFMFFAFLILIQFNLLTIIWVCHQ